MKLGINKNKNKSKKEIIKIRNNKNMKKLK